MIEERLRWARDNWAELTQQQREGVARIARQYREEKIQSPLSWVELWHSEKSSQREAAKLLSMSLIALIFGGNRSGKTELGAMLCLCYALGRHDPMVIDFCRKNRLDVNMFPDGPGACYAVALTSLDSRRYQRPKIKKFLPPGYGEWRNENGSGEAELTLYNGGIIYFKSVDQEARSFQGIELDLVWCDEDPEDKEVFNECLMRLLDRCGKMLVTMTPVRGKTWIYYEYVEKFRKHVRYCFLNSFDNPHVPKGYLRMILSNYTEKQQKMRSEGAFMVLEGLVYEAFSRNVHLIDAIPEGLEHMPRYGGIDFGAANPFCYLHAIHDTKKDILYITEEHYQARMLTSHHYEKIVNIHEKDEKPIAIFADPADKQSRIDLAFLGLPTMKAKKDIVPGINSVGVRLEATPERPVRLYIMRICTNLIREIEGYRWDERESKVKDKPNLPLDKDNHALDALRYICYGLEKQVL